MQASPSGPRGEPTQRPARLLALGIWADGAAPGLHEGESGRAVRLAELRMNDWEPSTSRQRSTETESGDHHAAAA